MGPTVFMGTVEVLEGNWRDEGESVAPPGEEVEVAGCSTFVS